VTAPATTAPARLLFIDWLRGWAIVVMIEVHVFNSFLRPELRETPWFRALNFVNGLVAPSFLFVSGFVFIVASRRRLDALRTFRAPFWRQLKRIGLVWLIAYALHLPPAPLSQYFSAFTELDWRAFYNVDVLHCIAATWFLLLVSVAVVRRERALRWWLLTVTLASTVLAPWVWSLTLSPPLTAPLAAYLNNRIESLFPLFPWSGFMLAGALCASLYPAAPAQGGERVVWPQLAGAALALIAFGALAPPLTWLPGGASANWAADPRSFALRLGIVLALLWACRACAQRHHARESSWLLIMSRESLFVYVGHILFLFAPLAGGRSVAQLLGQSHSPLFCALASLILIAVMTAAAWLWAWRKQTAAAK